MRSAPVLAVFQTEKAFGVYLCMGQMCEYQPLTREDRVSVFLYRAGIVLSALTLLVAAWVAFRASGETPPSWAASGTVTSAVLVMLQVGVGLSVFFIHLYVGRFHRILRRGYLLSLLSLGALFLLGKGNPSVPLSQSPPFAAILLLPITGCLGFITAKEAFCFRLYEGYLLALLMPLLVFLHALGAFGIQGIAAALAVVSGLMVLFVFRKVFMPVHCDIGDKSAYQP